MLLIPLGLDQSRGDQIDNAKNFESKGFGRTIPEDTLNAMMPKINVNIISKDILFQRLIAHTSSSYFASCKILWNKS